MLQRLDFQHVEDAERLDKWWCSTMVLDVKPSVVDCTASGLALIDQSDRDRQGGGMKGGNLGRVSYQVGLWE